MSTNVLENQPVTQESTGKHTPEELLRMPEGHRYELLDGNLVERNIGAESSLVATRVGRLVGNYVDAQKLGKSFATDCGYQIFPDKPNRVRYPDGSFIARGRLPDERVPRGHVRIPPDLAIEVVSPNDTAEEVETKRVAFLQAGTRLVWVIYPETRTVHVFQQAGNHAVLSEADDLTGGEVLPGFRCRVTEIFADL